MVLGGERLGQFAGSPRDLPFEMLLLFERPLLGVDPIRHVELRGEEIQQLAGLVDHRTHVEGVPKRRAVLAIVQQVDGDVASDMDRLTDLLNGTPVGIGDLEGTDSSGP